MEVCSRFCETERPSGSAGLAAMASIKSFLFSQKRVIDSILSGNVDQHVINAKELFFKVRDIPSCMSSQMCCITIQF